MPNPESSAVASPKELKSLKDALRQRAYAARRAQPDKEAASAVICGKFTGLEAYERAETVMWYLHCRSEVRTVPAVEKALRSNKRVVIPYCTRDAAGENKLGLWHLESFGELVRGTWNILEPPPERWGEPGKEVDPRSLDLIMVPGVAFDHRGGRLGNGQGYYDRLLARVRVETALVGVCYQCQLFERVPMGPDDAFMHRILTEQEDHCITG